MKNIIVLNREEASKFTYDESWAAISICDKTGRWPKLKTSNVLQLWFMDAIASSLAYPDMQLFEEFHAKEIFNFVKNNVDKIDLLLIHCEQGYCRSPAIAAVIDQYFLNGEVEPYFEKYNPNPLVYRILKETYEKQFTY